MFKNNRGTQEVRFENILKVVENGIMEAVDSRIEGIEDGEEENMMKKKKRICEILFGEKKLIVINSGLGRFMILQIHK